MKQFPAFVIVLALSRITFANADDSFFDRIRAALSSSHSDFDTSGFRISSGTTSNSSLLLEGPLPSNAAGILVTIKRTDSSNDSEQAFFNSDRATLSSRIYLRQGPGNYAIGVFNCPERTGSCTEIDHFDVKNTDSRDNSFLLPSPDVQSDDPQIIGLSLNLTAGLSSDLEKSRAIHRWVTSNIAYDVAAYFSNRYLTMPWDASTVYQTKQAICAGYTNLNAALHRAAGIRAKTIVGTAAEVFTGATSSTAGSKCNHGWNEILINGQWLPQDTTWDAGYVDFVSRHFSFSPNEKYFFPDAGEFSKTHQKCSEGTL